MYLQFLTPKGNPVYLRPELVAALAGYHTTNDGRPALATRIVLTNGEQFFVRGDVDAVAEGIAAWVEANTSKLVVGDPTTSWDEISRRSCEDVAACPVDQPVGPSDVRFAS